MKKIMVFVAAAAAAVMMSTAAFASNYITNMSVVLNEQDAEDGVMKDITLNPGNNTYEFTDVNISPEYSSWYPGKKVTITVTAIPTGDLTFKKAGTSVSVTNSNTEKISTSISPSKIVYKFNYNPKVNLPEPSNIHYDDNDEYLAKWNKVEYANYEVKIMELVTSSDGETESWTTNQTITISKPEINLSQYATGENETKFMVRSVPKKDDYKNYIVPSSWVDSEEISNSISNTTTGDFVNNSGIVTFTNDDGTKASGWQLLNGSWYYFDPVNNNTMIKSNWAFLNGRWYVFDKDGKMLKGWQQIDGYWYWLFDSGEMYTGWYKNGPSGPYYYLNQYDQSQDGFPYGAMLYNTTTPDGYAVAADGSWND